VVADQRPRRFHRRPQSDPEQMPYAVRSEEHAGSDLANGLRLFVNRNPQSLDQERVGRKQTADSASDDRNTGTEPRHSNPRKNYLVVSLYDCTCSVIKSGVAA
jgi:hypothetical protein